MPSNLLECGSSDIDIDPRRGAAAVQHPMQPETQFWIAQIVLNEPVCNRLDLRRTLGFCTRKDLNLGIL